MEGYGYQYPSAFPPMRPPEGEYPDHGDGFGEYYSLGTLNEDRARSRRRSRSKQRERKYRDTKRFRSRSSSVRLKSRSKSKSRSRTRSKSRSRSRTNSRTRTRSRSRSRSQSRSRSKTRSHSRTHSGTTRPRGLTYKEPGFLDAFRVLYLTPSNHRKQPSKFLATKKKQDRIQEILKHDGFGSKKWLFYPREKKQTKDEEEPPAAPVSGIRDNIDQRIKVDADFFKKYKKSKKIDKDAPINKLKRWELIFYKKLGFIQAV